MSERDPVRLRDAATAIARDAGAIVRAGYGRIHAPERKGRRAAVPFGALVYRPENNIWVWPGDTIVTEGWQVRPDAVALQVKVKERDEVVIAGAWALLSS